MNLVRVVEWAEGYNRRGLYSPIGVTFHWVMAALMVGQLAHGWYLAWLPAGGAKHLGYQTHAAIGLAVMVLGSLRFLWYRQVAGPKNVPEGTFTHRASRLIQAFFYASFFALPLSGWVMWSTLPGDLELRVAGVLPLPLLPFDQLSAPLQQRLMEGAATVHLWMVVLTMLAIPAHAGAAVLHHVFQRDRVLNSMLDLNGPQVPGVLGAPPNAGRAS